MHKNKLTKFGDYATRRDYSKVPFKYDLPNLIENQIKSYKWFLEEGMDEVFREFFPITSRNEKFSLHYHGLTLEEPKKTYQEAKISDDTYQAILKVRFSLTKNEIADNANPKKKKVKATETGKVKYFGEVPLLTDKATFIINGNEKVIISQLIRSPGVYFSISHDKKTNKPLFLANVVPARGTWLELATDMHDVLLMRVDKNRKFNSVLFLQSLGLSKIELTHLFGKSRLFERSLEVNPINDYQEALFKLMSYMRPGDPLNLKSAIEVIKNVLFDKRRYDLSKAGRFKLNLKLNLLDRLYHRVISEDLINVHTKEVVFKKGTRISSQEIEILKPLVAQGAFKQEIETEHFGKFVIQKANVYLDNDTQNDNETVAIIGNYCDENEVTITLSDIIASFSYLFNLSESIFSHNLLVTHLSQNEKMIGEFDDIDNLANRRVRLVGELIQNQWRIGFTRIEKNVLEAFAAMPEDNTSIEKIINHKPLTGCVKEFFNTSQLSQFMDQTNPLSEITNKRRLTTLGPGGLSRERAGMEVRDVHPSHYGRICPIETPEGPNIGLINNLTAYARINNLGFIETPYFIVENGKVKNEVKYLTVGEEKDCFIAASRTPVNEDGDIINQDVVVRYRGENISLHKSHVNYMDISPKQVVSIATTLIPFLETDDANRALMGANMQRQAVPLLAPHSPIVGTGVEYVIARDCGLGLKARVTGKVSYVDSTEIKIVDANKKTHTHQLPIFLKSNQNTCIHNRPIVNVGDEVVENQIIADGPSMQKGELALGQNVTVAFTTWNGYNYEDAIILSDRLIKEDLFTSVHLSEYIIEARITKLGEELITSDIPGISDESKKYLDENGIVMVGAEVKEGDILVGKITPKGHAESSPEEKLLQAIFGEKSRSMRDNSLRLPNGANGVVHSVTRFSRSKGDKLANDVNEVVKVVIIQKRKIQEGDKMAGRHGNKGVVSKILPMEDMPFLPDGTPVDVMLNPLGVPSRMNIGQILELHTGWSASKLGIKISTPIFEGLTKEELKDLINEAKVDEDGKSLLTNGVTGEKFSAKISVGTMYMLKLDHMVDDKIHVRSTGPYSLITQQPLGGKAQNGGQRFGEMEVWALEAYGASHLLQEMLTIKSDDMSGRTKAYEAIVRGMPIPKPNLPESFLVLVRELKALGLSVDINKNEQLAEQTVLIDGEPNE